LRVYKKGKTASNCVEFKKILWNSEIKKTKTTREQWFIVTIFQKVTSGSFFIIPLDSNNISSYYDEFVNDGILGDENSNYFITHDIYEEWALEKKIESEFAKNKQSEEKFFQEIGESLPIRRSFRNWLFEKLLLNDDHSIIIFIQNVMESKTIGSFWQDEILVSILLSDYSETFFTSFKKNLLKDNQSLLKRVVKLIRTSCKTNGKDIDSILTEPKGSGWINLIKFIYENKDSIDIKNIGLFMDLFYYWNSKSCEGVTTKQSSLIALQYYQYLIKERCSFGLEHKHIFITIIYGSSEIKLELEKIFKEIFENKWRNHADPYYTLSEIILTTLEAFNICKTLPEYVLKLANLFWINVPKNDLYSDYPYRDTVQSFNIGEMDDNYNPASAYQTPIYFLLQVSLQNTVDFVLEFTNQAVEHFINSTLAKNSKVEVVYVFADENEPAKQYISDGLWNIYRGTQDNPRILESIHMALEKFFLELAKDADSNTLERWLLYLLKNSRSASISAMVTSIVLAYPDKTFNIAKILFKTKEFFFYDTRRLSFDPYAYAFIHFGIPQSDVLCQKERISASKESHRKMSLENLMLCYQMFKNEHVNEIEAKNRQTIIWDILDQHYVELPNPLSESNADKDWRLCLAGMDKRKGKQTIEEKDGKLLISHNPEVDPILKEYAENSGGKNLEYRKYDTLKTWAFCRIIHNEQYKQYEQYEKNPHLALEKVKEIVSDPKRTDGVLNSHISHVCFVLIKYYFDNFSKEEKIFCKDIIIKAASSSLSPNYKYQIFDGTEVAIAALPILLDEFPEEKKNIKEILLLTLFNEDCIKAIEASLLNYLTESIYNLWERNVKEARSLLLGYLLLKPKYEKLKEKFWQKNHNQVQTIEIFLKENKENIYKMVEGDLSFNDVNDIQQLELSILKTAFQLLPLKIENNELKEIAKSIILVFAEKLLSNHKEQVEPSIKNTFLDKLANLTLRSSNNDIKYFLEPFIDNFKESNVVAELFQKFIKVEYEISTYDNFWHVWSLFRDKVIELPNRKHCIIESYLFAKTDWKEMAEEWHSFREGNKNFFKEVLEKLGYCSSVLYPIAKLLNGVGGIYIKDGISWLSKILRKIKDDKIKCNTISYLENIIEKYINANGEIIKKEKKHKEDVLIILDFLIKKSSDSAYRLREKIL
jgi:hypothetical protein